MTIGEILRIALVDTLLGMGTVFSILIFISICIWLLGIVCREKKPSGELVADAKTPSPKVKAKAAAVKANAPAARANPAAAGVPAAASPDDESLAPETIAAITAAIHMYMKANEPEEEYIVRNVRRAKWKHTS